MTYLGRANAMSLQFVVLSYNAEPVRSILGCLWEGSSTVLAHFGILRHTENDVKGLTLTCTSLLHHR